MGEEEAMSASESLGMQFDNKARLAGYKAAKSVARRKRAT